MNKKYKAAVIGVGFIGAGSHVPAYQTDERCELVAVADLKPGAAEYVAKRYGVEKFYGDHAADAGRVQTGCGLHLRTQSVP